MERRGALALLGYGVLLGSVFTPLYDSFSSGRNQWWVLRVLVVAVHFGVGTGVARAWALVLPAGLGAGLAILGDEPLDRAFAIAAMVVLVGATAAGWLLARFRAEAAVPLTAAAFGIAAIPAAWAAFEQSKRGEKIPPSLAAQLPIDLNLANLCPGSETPGRLRRELRGQAEVLIRELRRRPYDLVSYTFHDAHGDDETRDITIRELAEEQLWYLEANEPCELELRRRLEDALD